MRQIKALRSLKTSIGNVPIWQHYRSSSEEIFICERKAQSDSSKLLNLDVGKHCSSLMLFVNIFVYIYHSNNMTMHVDIYLLFFYPCLFFFCFLFFKEKTNTGTNCSLRGQMNQGVSWLKTHSAVSYRRKNFKLCVFWKIWSCSVWFCSYVFFYLCARLGCAMKKCQKVWSTWQKPSTYGWLLETFHMVLKEKKLIKIFHRFSVSVSQLSMKKRKPWLLRGVLIYLVLQLLTMTTITTITLIKTIAQGTSKFTVVSFQVVNFHS